VALLIVAAASGVAVGQQCARRPLPVPTAAAKLVVAAALAAVVMALLGYAGGGKLGNFGVAGVDQTTFGPAVFLWFVSIGGLTVAMTGGIARRPKRVGAPAPVMVDEPPIGPPAEPPAVAEPPAAEDEYEDADEVAVEYDYDLEAEEIVEARENVEIVEIVEIEPVPAPPAVTRIVRHPDLDDDDPEEHFVTDDDASPGATSDDARRSAD
jgi:hypothetical protein